MYEAITNLIGAVANAGVGVVIGNLIECNTPSDLKRGSRILSKVGAVAVTAVISDLVSKHIEKSIKEFGEEAGFISNDEEDTDDKEEEN